MPDVDGTPVGARVRDQHGDWHASISYDGYVHGLACGLKLDADDVEAAALPTRFDMADATIHDACQAALDGDGDG